MVRLCSQFLESDGNPFSAATAAPVGTQLVFLSDELIRTMQISAPAGWHQLSSYSEALQRAGISSANLGQATAVFNLPAFVIVALLTALLVKGIRESAIFNSIIVVVKVTVILAVMESGSRL